MVGNCFQVMSFAADHDELSGAAAEMAHGSNDRLEILMRIQRPNVQKERTGNAVLGADLADALRRCRDG